MNFSIFEDTWRVPRNDLIAANPALAANPAFAPLLVAGEDAVVTPHEGGWLICAGGCVHHAGALHLPSSASRKIAWPTVAVYAGVAGVAGWWLWRRRARGRSGGSMLMAPPLKSGAKWEREQAAINAGFWFAKDHGRWIVGRGTGSKAVTLSTGHATKAEARTAMMAAWKASA